MNERIGLGKVRIFVMIGLIGLLMSKNLFSQGSLFPVKIDNKWGFIDKNGKMIVSPEFDAVGNYSESFIPVKIGGVWGFADENGKIKVNPQFTEVRNFSNGYAAVKLNGCLLYTSPSPRDRTRSRMPSSA